MLIFLAMSSEVKPVRLSSYLSTLPSDEPLVFFIGAMAHGHDDWVDDIVDDKISISDYPLSAAVTCSKLVKRFHSDFSRLQTWKICGEFYNNF